jgi:hypothetical protein
MQDQQVDLADADLLGALLETVQRLVVPVIADPDLGLDEHLGPVDAGPGDRLADLTLVAVRAAASMAGIATLSFSLNGGWWT